MATDITTPYAYGVTTDKRNPALEQQGLEEEQGLSSAVSGANILDPNFISTLNSDPATLAFYVNALAYGGYTIGDVLNDMSRRQLVAQGNTQAASLTIIDPEMNKTSYLATPSGAKSVTDTAQVIPTFNFQGLLNTDILKYGANIPDDLFKILVPISDPNSQAFKDQVNKIKSDFFDAASAVLQANTEQDKAIADTNYRNLVDSVQKTYGITLSNDADKAWGQLQTIGDNNSKAGISGSGIQNQQVDKELQAIRKSDQTTRDNKLTTDEANKAAYYRASGTSAQIAQLTPEQRQAWGLTPSSDIAQKFSIAALTAAYPSLTAQEIQAKHDAVLDENGNYRSTVYANYYNGITANQTTTNTNAINKVTSDANTAETNAYKNYDATTSFLGQTTKGNIQATTPSADTSAAASAAGKISADINKFNTNNGALLKPGESYQNSAGQMVTQGTPVTNEVPPKTNTNITSTTTPITNSKSSNTALISANKKIQTDLNTKYAGQNGWTPLVVDGIIGPKTQAAQNFKPTPSGPLSGFTLPTINTNNNTGIITR